MFLEVGESTGRLSIAGDVATYSAESVYISITAASDLQPDAAR